MPSRASVCHDAIRTRPRRTGQSAARLGACGASTYCDVEICVGTMRCTLIAERYIARLAGREAIATPPGPICSLAPYSGSPPLPPSAVGE